MWFLSLQRIMSDKHKRLTSAKNFIHGKKTRARSSKRSPSDETTVAMPTASCSELLPSQDANTIEVNWESPKISQGRQSKVKSTADLLPNVSPTDSNEVTPPSCSPLIQIRYRSPLDSHLMSTPLRHQGGREKNAHRRMNSRPTSTDDVMQHVINAISCCHNKDLSNQTRSASGTTDPMRIDLVINESTEVRNGITVDRVAAVLSSSLESRSQQFTKVNALSTKKDVVAVIAQLDTSTAESEIWTDDEFFLSEAVLEVTQTKTNTCQTIPHSENSRSISPQCIKRKCKQANTPDIGVKKSGRYTFALENGEASRTSNRLLQPCVSLLNPLFSPPPINRRLVEKACSQGSKEASCDTSITDELLATIADPDFVFDTQIDNQLPVDKGCHAVGNESEIVGPTKSKHDENGCKLTGVKNEPDVSEMFGDDDLTEQQLMAYLDTVESQVPQSSEPQGDSLSVTMATTDTSSRFSKQTSAIASTCKISVDAEKTTSFGRVASFNIPSTTQPSGLRAPLSYSNNTQNQNKVSIPCAKGNALKSFPTKVDSFPSKAAALDHAKTGIMRTNSHSVTSAQSIVRSREVKERSFTSVTRLNVKSLSSDSIRMRCEADDNRFGSSSQNQSMCGQSQRYSPAEIEQKKREALRRRELKLKGKPLSTFASH